MNELLAWFTDPAQGIPGRLLEHIAICSASILAATAIGLPVGLFIGHTGRGARLAINLANVGRAIPSYAVLAIILTITIQIDPENGLALYPTFGAMTLLAIPPILVGAYSGLRAVDRDLIEAARGMGLREREILSSVELPLALPIIVGGFRTASLQVIATATIGAIVSLGGLGRYIFDGALNHDNLSIYGGAILVAGLAIGVDLLLALVQRTITPPGIRIAVEAARVI